MVFKNTIFLLLTCYEEQNMLNKTNFVKNKIKIKIYQLFLAFKCCNLKFKKNL